MYKSISCLILFVVLSLDLSAYIPEYLQPGFGGEYRPEYKQKHKNKGEVLQGNQDPVIRNYDVLNYDINLDWYDVMKAEADTAQYRYWTGSVSFNAVLKDDNISSLEVDAGKFEILSVKVNGTQLVNTPQCSETDLLVIDLLKAYNKNETLKIDIAYKFTNPENKGFYLYNKNTFVELNPFIINPDSLVTLERIAYTQGEPRDTRFWFPCNDNPHDKALVSLTARVPKDYTVSSVGKLINKYIAGDTAVFEWKSADVMPTYLVCANASIYYTYSDTYKNKKGEDIEIQYYIWKKDYDNETVGYNPREAFSQTVEMMQFFSDLFIDYPYEKYGMTAVYPYDSGGMEHQTLTTIHRDWMRGTFDYGGIAHELAHQWLGDYITCSSFRDLWINEGGATFAASLWYLYKYGINAYLAEVSYNGDRYKYRGGYWYPPIYDPREDLLFSGALTYSKASLIYNMLFVSLGEDPLTHENRFILTLREMLNRYKLSAIGYDEFKAVCKEMNPDFGIDWDIWFDQWVKKKGHPIFSVETRTAEVGDNYNIKTKLSQIQSYTDVPDLYQVPVHLIYKFDNNQSDTIMYYMTEKVQEFSHTFPQLPISVEMDTLKLLCQVMTNSIAAVETNKILETSVFPSIISSGDRFKLSFTSCPAEEIQIEMVDLLGRKIKDLYSGQLENSSAIMEFGSGELISGTYFIKIKSKTISSNLKIIVK